MPTHSASPQTADIISAARSEQRMTLREFGAALSVSHTIVGAWEAGTGEPDRARIAAWIADERAWVQVLGLRLFARQYHALIRNVLVPA